MSSTSEPQETNLDVKCATRPAAAGNSHQMDDLDLSKLLTEVIPVVLAAGERIKAEWNRIGGPRGSGSTAAVDTEIEEELREKLLALLPADFWGGGNRAFS